MKPRNLLRMLWMPTLCVLALLAPPAPDAHAQALFAASGSPTLTPLPVGFNINPVGPDKNGYMYGFGELDDACWHPSDKEGTTRYIYTHSNGGKTSPLVSPTQAGVIQHIYNPSGERYQYYLFDCAAAQASPALGPDRYQPLMLGFVAGADVALLKTAMHFRLADGRPCARTFAADNGQYSVHWRTTLSCPVFDPATAETKAAPLEVRADGTKLDALLGLQPYQDLVPGEPAPFPHRAGYPDSPVDEGWRFESPVVTADGRLFFIGTRRTIYAKGGQFTYPRWLFESKANGDIEVIVSPNNSKLHDFHNDMIGELFADSRYPGLLLSPVYGQEWGNYMTMVSGYGEVEFGPGGFGYVVVDLATHGVGYLSVTDMVARVGNTKNVGLGTFQLTNGEMGLLISNLWYRLELDPATFDLDLDGLTATQEKALGTSDYRADTDYGSTRDSWEVQVAGTDPTLASDDQWGPEALLDRVGYTTSTLVRKKLPAATLTSRIPSLSADAPLCTTATCFDVRGNVTATPALPADATLYKISADASYIAWRQGNTLRRYVFATQQTELVADSTELARHLGTDVDLSDSLHPIDASLMYFVRSGAHPRVVAFRTGKASEVAFDWDQANCDSKLGACNPTQDLPGILFKHEELLPVAYPMTYEAETGRFLVGVKSSWRQFVVGLRPDKPPELLVVGRDDPYVVKRIMVPSGYGDYYTDVDFIAPDLTYRPTGGVRNSFSHDSPITVWGKTMLVESDEGFGTYELVRYQPQIEPGEVFLIAADGSGAPGDIGMRFYRHNLRGGTYKAWYRFPAVYGPLTTGMDVTADLRLCTVDNTASLVREYVPLTPGTVPQFEVASHHLLGARDCLYSPDGSLRVLIAKAGKVAPAVLKRAAGTMDFVAEPGVKLPPLPERFIKKPGGAFEVLGREDPASGKLYTRSGHVVTLRRGTFNLEWDGVTFLDLIPGASQGYQGGAAIVERPDGLLVVTFSDSDDNVYKAFAARPLLVDPRDGSVVKLELAYASALAVVPGGLSIDPWSGDPVPVAEPKAPTDGSGPKAFGAPAAPTGGEVVAQASAGCSSGARPRASALPMLFVVGLVVGVRRRKGAFR
ncbi:MAG: hypothetical protein ACOYOB_12715 [Myxococcota bacterium]